MKIRKELKSLIGKKVTVKIKDTDGYYYDDMCNEIFNKADAEYYEEYLQTAYLYGIEYCSINNIYIIEIHE